ncbi:transcriptional regulator family: Fungal Specific TF [Paecilomyces variotii]|nr:transcriptional regulator family: Fungal Specific TF [Paecilomyces variotii]KAJ9281102.1 transcriptional regulator family: Fungal Specific TF [Paecilomyces variotii]KAJ9345475.1 transcriptional regulator family: Fungal Specific TF [Paecilomyces variotii]KAJ9386038.1 transcriptional regulator family: Fungal Specific TF [Paecilomyces variotii]
MGTDQGYINPLGDSRQYAAMSVEPPNPTRPLSSLSHRASYGKDIRDPQSLPSQGQSNMTSISGSSRPRQQLPHVVDERYIEGEGLCYIYADGSHCPKSIDGVPVNANWGVTKAGKPRKRLAQACISCREKKIKCQPNIPKCDQCQKSGKECRFESAPRGHSAAAKGSHEYRSISSRAKESSSNQSPLSDSSIMSSVGGTIRGARSDPSLSQKRGSSNSSSGTTDHPRWKTSRAASGDGADRVDILADITDVDPDDPMVREWATDPYEANPEAMSHYIEKYFTYVNDGFYYIFPKRNFLEWLRSCRTKSPDDKMLIYSMMAMGSVFSDRPDNILAGKRYSKTASYAVEKSQHALTLQLAQSRIILSLWYYSIGALVKAWDLIGAAVRTVCGLDYNIEAEGLTRDTSQTCEYGLQPQSLIECRRRTFWVAFILDRLPGFYSFRPVSVQSQDSFLRLPCPEDVYEAEQYTITPYFQNTIDRPQTLKLDEQSSLSAMSSLIELAFQWGEVTNHVIRSPHIPQKTYTTRLEEFNANVTRRLEESNMNLPETFIYSMANIERSIRTGSSDMFVSVHMLYHAVLMRLHRHVRLEYLSGEAARINIGRARHHAAEILRISLAVTQLNSGYDPSTSTRRVIFSYPLISYLILCATDVLSAAGLTIDLSECISLIHSGLDVIDDLCRFWESARIHSRLIEKRLEAIISAARNETKLDDKVGFVVNGPPLYSRAGLHGPKMEPGTATDLDIIYGFPRDQYLRVLALDASISKEDVLWIREDP